MAPSNDDLWSGERGGFDDFEWTIEEAKFGFDEKYDAAVGRNVPSFIATGEAVLADGNRFPASKQRWGIGKFDPVDGGARAVHESGEDKMFHYQSGYMAFVRGARNSGAAEEIEKRCEGNPLNLRNASIWVGMRFRMQRVEAGTFKNDEGKEQAYTQLVPTEFLGTVGGSAPAKAATSNGSGNADLEATAKGMDKMDFLDIAVREKKMDIAEAEIIWDKANA